MSDVRTVAILLTAATLGCSSRSYDWSPALRVLDRALPDGSPQARVTAVLDSLAFRHGQLDLRDSTITASRREPHATGKLVFSTLQVAFKFSGDGHLLHRTSKEVFTGP
jgi:hypothetical protein